MDSDPDDARAHWTTLILRWLPWSRWRYRRKRFIRAERLLLRSGRRVTDGRDSIVAAHEATRRRQAGLQKSLDALYERTTPEGALKMLAERSHTKLRITREKFEALKKAVGDPDGLQASFHAEYRSYEFWLKHLDKSALDAVEVAKLFDRERADFTMISYRTHRTRAATLAAIAALESAVHEHVTSTWTIQPDAEAAASQ